MRRASMLLAITFITLILSCNEDKENTQMKEVMTVHDEVMPKMGQLGQMVGKLKAMENDSTEMGRQYQNAREDLQEANGAMMDWMQNFGNRFTPDEILNGAELSAEKKRWLDEEEEKVKELQGQIDSSIEKAEKLLGQKDSSTL